MDHRSCRELTFRVTATCSASAHFQYRQAEYRIHPAWLSWRRPSADYRWNRALLLVLNSLEITFTNQQIFWETWEPSQEALIRLSSGDGFCPLGGSEFLASSTSSRNGTDKWCA